MRRFHRIRAIKKCGILLGVWVLILPFASFDTAYPEVLLSIASVLGGAIVLIGTYNLLKPLLLDFDVFLADVITTATVSGDWSDHWRDEELEELRRESGFAHYLYAWVHGWQYRDKKPFYLEAFIAWLFFGQPYKQIRRSFLHHNREGILRWEGETGQKAPKSEENAPYEFSMSKFSRRFRKRSKA